jgi:hypothetical protein
MSMRRAFIALGATLALAGIVRAANKEDPFQVPRPTIVATVKTIGIMPLDLNEAVPNAAAVAARYESAIANRLEAAGFSVVRADVMREIRDGLLRESGGVYNPIDGKALEDKLKHLISEARDRYMVVHPVDGILYPRIAVRRAETDYDQARWDGVSEAASGKSFLTSLFTTGGTLSGTTPALSLIVTLTDRGDRTLYRKAGGLQLLRYAYVGWFGATQRDVDPRYILTDPQRDERALALALDPLAGSVSPAANASVERLPGVQSDAARAAHGTSADLVAHYPHVLVVPLQMADLPQTALVRTRVTQALIAKLAALGFKATEAADYEAQWRSERERAGGFFDPLTGRLDRDKVQRARNAVFSRLAEGQDVQAIVYPATVLTLAPFAQGNAQWDGVKERAFVARSSFGKLFNPAKTLVGQLDALSLKLRVADAQDETLLEDSGGLQLLERIQDGARAAVSKEELFTDPGRESSALDIALQSLYKDKPAGPPH